MAGLNILILEGYCPEHPEWWAELWLDIGSHRLEWDSIYRERISVALPWWHHEPLLHTPYLSHTQAVSIPKRPDASVGSWAQASNPLPVTSLALALVVFAWPS